MNGYSAFTSTNTPTVAELAAKKKKLEQDLKTANAAGSAFADPNLQYTGNSGLQRGIEAKIREVNKQIGTLSQNPESHPRKQVGHKPTEL